MSLFVEVRNTVKTVCAKRIARKKNAISGCPPENYLGTARVSHNLFRLRYFRTPLRLGLGFGLPRADTGTGKSLLEVQVMTTFNPLKLVAIVLVIGLATIPLYAQEQAGAQSGQSPSSGQSSAQSAQAQPQTFSGKIVKSKGGLALKDKATNTPYKLDNENQPNKYT